MARTELHDDPPFPTWQPPEGKALSELESLVYRSRRLGSDLRITNFGGGNTSAKIRETDPLTGETVLVLWVKGSGGDLGSIDKKGFASLYLSKLVALKEKYRGLEHEDEMVDYLPYCTFGLNPRAASIDTPIHAFIPYVHVDHIHPDDLIAIAASKNGRGVTEDIFEGEMAWLDYIRPGFELGLRVEALAQKNRALKGVMLGGHGVVTWGGTSQQCYERSIEAVQRARAWLRAREKVSVFGPPVVPEAAEPERRAFIEQVLPVLRGVVSQKTPKLAHVVDSPEVMQFVSSARLPEFAALGTSCPDHFLRTKRKPLVLDYTPGKDNVQDAIARLPQAIAAYRADYEAYYQRCKRPDSPAVRDSNPVVVLVRGVGMICFANDKATARIASEFYVNAINVIRGAETAGGYIGLEEQQAFDVEYWALEEAKLQRMPKPKALAGQIAYITGAAGGIGMATARRLLADGATVFLADIDESRLETARQQLVQEYSADRIRAGKVDVTDEKLVQASFAQLIAELGGIDILVSNAGIASSAPFEDITTELWDRNSNIMSRGYFLVSREAFRIMKKQGNGGSIVFVASKNGLAASPKAAAYCTAKAAEVHLARCIALDGAPLGIRANVVNPDAVLSESNIWQGEWAKQRAAAYGITVEQLPEYYKSRSLLRREVLPEDVAEGVAFFCGPGSLKSTGNILNVDAGNAGAFTR
jgi:rhamnulose-1-phosphate aldolase/alcohol dehydrogenase